MKKKLSNNIDRKENKSVKKYPFWFYLILFFIPILFLIILETSLRVFSYGEKYEVFVELTPSTFPNTLFFNPELPRKYFTNIDNPPGVIADGFEKEKSKNTFRVFVLGESSTAGWPFNANANLSRHLKWRLELLYPNSKIEVINLGISAVNTYTIRDLVPEVLEHNPDLIVFYNGHNEYYGVLGVASSQTIGRSRFLINTVLWLQEFRLVQLVQNTLTWGMGLFAEEKALREKGENETLMGRMIGESLIPLNSEIFQNGIEQFEGNMRDILELCKNENVPVILGMLTSNLKDQKPFISINEGNAPSAESIFNKARELYSQGNFDSAKVLFYLAKDLDALKFRAPQKINDVIQSLGAEFNFSVVNFDSIFNSASQNGITGNNLMVDHLHPTVEGYQLMGKKYFLAMEENNLLPKTDRKKISPFQVDSIMKKNLPFTPLDSTIAALRVKILVGSFPFVPKGSQNLLVKNFKPQNYIDSLAIYVIDKFTTWEEAHFLLAERYHNENKIDLMKKEFEAVYFDKPKDTKPLTQLVTLLIARGKVNEAVQYLEIIHKINPDEFSSKWLGAIALNNNEIQTAIRYLEMSVALNIFDPQVWFNLSGAYAKNEQLDKAIEAIEKCLNLSPNNPIALDLYNQLMKIKEEGIIIEYTPQ
ncbi:MAG: hypothetical protein C0442_09965 [Chlorobiaceae bacterium]|nr:hypothetical protein [Chlorobiaceae bacterium]